MSEKEDKLCHEIHVSLTALVAGELDEEARAVIEQHLSYCPGCQFEWREHELVWRCLTRCENVEPPAILKDRVLKEIERHERRR